MNPEVAPPSLAETLHRYSRYLAIVAEQLEASAEGDLQKLMTLLGDRIVLEVDLEPFNQDEDEPVASLDELLMQALAEVNEKVESDRLDKDQWVQLSNDALTSARTLSLRPAAAAGRYPEPGATGERLDRRF